MDDPFGIPQEWVRKAYYDAILKVLRISSKPQEIKDQILKDLEEAEGNEVNTEKLKKWVYATQIKKNIDRIESAYEKLIEERQIANQKQIAAEAREQEEKLKKYERKLAVVDDFSHLKDAITTITAYRDYLDLANQFWKIQPFFYNREGMWWMWNFENYKWELVDDTDIMNAIDTALKQPYTINSKVKNEIIESMRRVGRKRMPKDAPLRWIQFKDKAFSLRSGKIHNITPDYFFTNPIPWSLGESEDTPTLDKLFKEWVGDKYSADLYEVLAYCCYRSYPIQTLICLYGSGRNGKSSYLKILDKFLGEDNITSTELDLLMGSALSRFESFKLYKKLCCLLGETNFGVLDKSSMLKKLVGGDKIGFEMKNKAPFTDYNYAKIIIASNSLPPSDDTSEGFFRRWHIVDFPNEFPEGKDITLTITDKEYQNLARKVLNILVKLLDKGMFTNQGTIPERKQKYQMASNPLPKFIEMFCKVTPTGYIRYSELYTAYSTFLSHNKRRMVSKKEFSKNITSEGFENRKTSKENIVDYYVEGLLWKESVQIFPNFLDFQKFSTSISHRETNWNISEIREIEENAKINIAKPTSEIISGDKTYLPCSKCGLKSVDGWTKHQGNQGKLLCDYCASQETNEEPIK